MSWISPRAQTVITALSDYTDWEIDSLWDWLLRHKSGLTLCLLGGERLNYNPDGHSGGPLYTWPERWAIVPEAKRVRRRLQAQQVEQESKKLLGVTP